MRYRFLPIFILMAASLLGIYTALHFAPTPEDITDTLTEKCDDGFWFCSHCQHSNPNWKLYCELCWH